VGVVRGGGGFCCDRVGVGPATPAAPRLYEALGFAPCAGEADCTHAFDLRVTR
jgi:hypothetical protein